MALVFPYSLTSMGRPIVPLGGRWVRPRPTVFITAIGPNDARLEQALVDPGADETVFPDRLAARIGIDLSTAPRGSGSGVGSGRVPLRYAEVTLSLTDGIELREWRAWVGFTSAPIGRALLGFAGCLQFFTATFHGDREQVELDANALYPGP